MTRAEKKLWYEFLNKFKPRVHRQRAIGRYVVDFYIAKAALVIEIDGDSHFIENAEKKDALRTKFLNSLNLHVMRFTNNDVFFSFENVCGEITNFVDKNLISNTPPDPL